MLWEMAKVSLEVISLCVSVYVLGSFPGCFFSSTPKKRTWSLEASNIAGPNNLATWSNSQPRTISIIFTPCNNKRSLYQKQNKRGKISWGVGCFLLTGTNNWFFLSFFLLVYRKRELCCLVREEISTLDGRKGEVAVKVPIPRTEIELRKKERIGRLSSNLASRNKKMKTWNLEEDGLSFFFLSFAVFLCLA